MKRHPCTVGAMSIIFAAPLIFFLFACDTSSGPADLVIRGGKIITVEVENPEAEAIAIQGDKIVAVGTAAAIEPYVGASTRIIELNGAVAIPGFIEGHGHFMGLGLSKKYLELHSTRNWDEIVAMVREAASKAKPGEWILGRGWHQEKWNKPVRPNVEGFPYHTALSQAAPNNPVALRHASGHASIANAKAMELAGITASTPDPEGGEILHDKQGNPIGVFRERAQVLLQRALLAWQNERSPEEIEADDRETVALAVQECLKKGVTSFEDAGSTFEEVDFFKRLVDEGELGVRLWVMILDSLKLQKQKFPEYRIVDYGDHRLTVRAIKRVMDGALGPRGAWLLEPYRDAPSSTGLNTSPIEDIRASGEIAQKYDLQLCVHAIGDRANRETLDLYESLFQGDPGGKNRRWRIEHAQHLSTADIPRFAQLGVIAAMQGIHCTSDAPYVLARLGPKRAEEGAYVWQKLYQTGAVIANGTDTPVEDIDPIQCYFASVTRKLTDGTLFYPDQCMTREEALRSYTLDAAYAAFQEESKGSLKPGKLADVTILSQDITTIPDDEILSTKVLYTIVGGKVMYER